MGGGRDAWPRLVLSCNLDTLLCRPSVRGRYVKHFFTSRAKDWAFFKDKPHGLLDELARHATVITKAADEEVFLEKVGCALFRTSRVCRRVVLVAAQGDPDPGRP